MPTIHMIIYVFNIFAFWVFVLVFARLSGSTFTLSPFVPICGIAFLLIPVAFGVIRRHVTLRCPGCHSWFAPVKYSEGERGGLLLGLSWYPRWVKGHYLCKHCNHSWVKINRLPSGDAGP